MFIILYVDDVGFTYSNEGVLNALIDSLVSKGFELTREGTFSEYLGIKFEANSSGNVSMTQQGLIKKIIKSMDLEDCNPNRTPSLKEALGMDTDGPSMSDTWSYPSVVGMLLYLSGNTRPDITFAVSQVARFTHAPKQSHAIAVKRIARYLAGTSTMGIIVCMSSGLSLTSYVDADFAGLYKRDPDHEPTSAKSRTGYIIKLGDCPLVWKSQLQHGICLSTSESEYSALSQNMRVLLPIRDILLEFVQIVKIPSNLHSVNNTINTTVHEDNSSALLLATNQRITSRTRYYNVKWHFFWDHVKKGNIKVVKVASADQCADYLTKGLVIVIFERCRKLNQGW